ncbi:MAG: hypothetical protein WCG66_11315 [bacterium]
MSDISVSLLHSGGKPSSFRAMPTLAIVFGIILDAMGFGAFVGTGSHSFTALIPCIFGTIIFLCGLLSVIFPKIRMHLMHVAALVGLLGTLGGLGMGLSKVGGVIAGTSERPVAVIMQIAMGTVCLVFLALCVKSFIDARRARKSK